MSILSVWEKDWAEISARGSVGVGTAMSVLSDRTKAKEEGAATENARECPAVFVGAVEGGRVRE